METPLDTEVLVNQKHQSSAVDQTHQMLDCLQPAS